MEFKIHAGKFMDNQLYQKNSLLSLTEMGQKLIKDSGFEDIFNTIKDDLTQEFFTEQNPKTKYDVQEKARGFMDDYSRKEFSHFLPIKTYAYEKGEDYTQILRAGSILLRDYYLEKHPEIEK